MDLALNEEQKSLQGVLREYFESHAPESAVRLQMDDPAGYDQVLWRQMAGELDLLGLAVPEEYGGGGFTFVELGITMEEMGRALVVSPFLASCVMSTQLLLALDDEEAKKEFLPAIVGGAIVATVAIAEDSGSWEPTHVQVEATHTESGWVLGGHKSFVLDGAIADVLFVVARVDDRVGVFAVQGEADGLQRQPLPTMDMTRKLARLTMQATPGRLLGSFDSAGRAIATMLDRTAIALAAESLGGTGKVLEMAVDYAKVRQQFGRQIGSFQAIKHKCASMLVDLESARSAVYYALWAASIDHADTPRVSSLVKAFCTDTYLHACGENIQIHGGIGFTWEHPAHLYFKRAKNVQLFLGSSNFHRQQLADRIGI